MLTNQKDKFKLPDHVSYINCAFMSPILLEVEKIGHKAISQKCLPFQITGNDFFTNVKKAKQLFAELVSITDYQILL